MIEDVNCPGNNEDLKERWGAGKERWTREDTHHMIYTYKKNFI